MSTRPVPAALGWQDLVLAWTGALVGLLVGIYGAAHVVSAIRRTGGFEALVAWAWLPWVAGGVLCGLAAGGVLLLLRARVPWWGWVLSAAVVPPASAPVSWLVVRDDVPLSSVVETVVTQAAMAVVVAATMSGIAALVRRSRTVPSAAGYAS